MTKKQICMIGIFAVCFMLTGCCMNHEWKEATCTEPKTCTKCGKTEGEAMEHTWVEATCSEAKHCSVCGETEGEPLAHTWVEATCAEAKHCSVCGETEGKPLEHTLTEANYQQAAICEVCGETVGEPLTPYFVENKIKGQFMESGKTYDYVTVCDRNGDSNLKTVGQATVTDYQTFVSDDTHEEKAGFEWKTGTVQIVFSDDIAHTYGMDVQVGGSDYYTNGTVNYNGQDYTDECMSDFNSEWVGGWETGSVTYKLTFEYLLPVGYDGIILVFYNPSEITTGNISELTDDTLFFRLD